MTLTVDPATLQLPPGRHPATWDEIEDLFVDRAPHRQSRGITFEALRHWAYSCWALFPSARLWVDGGFVTHKQDAPLDADVFAVLNEAEVASVSAAMNAELDALRVSPTAKCPTLVRFSGLWTLQLVTAYSGAVMDVIPRVQAYGGHVDAFWSVEGNLAALDVFHENWSMGLGQIPKGYLEVTA